jgi:hypothetical protein
MMEKIQKAIEKAAAKINDGKIHTLIIPPNGVGGWRRGGRIALK